jgi:hypothetical protein
VTRQRKDGSEMVKRFLIKALGLVRLTSTSGACCGQRSLDQTRGNDLLPEEP